MAAGLYLRLSGWEWCIVVLCCGGVFAAELLNTAIECVIDMFVKEHNEQAGKAKDIAAGATLIWVVASLIVGLIVLVPHVLRLIGVQKG